MDSPVVGVPLRTGIDTGTGMRLALEVGSVEILSVKP